MTKEALAALLHGREYGDEITDEEAAAAHAAGLLVVFGYSDDAMEFYGLFRDEAYPSRRDKPPVRFDAKGLMPKWDDILDRRDEQLAANYFFRQRGDNVREITALWNAEPGISWTYQTTLPHATFEVKEDGNTFCRGLVLAASELWPPIPVVAPIALPPAGEALRVRYRNWRGETSTRTIRPLRLEWGSTSWHPEPQFLLVALDPEDNNVQKSFALADCDFLGQRPDPDFHPDSRPDPRP